MLIQYILIGAIILVILRLLFKLKSKEISWLEFLGWLVIWLVAIVIIWRPNLTSILAIKFGVTRGVDLVIYTSIVLIFYLLFRMLMRVNKIDKDITKIVRQVALKDENSGDKWQK